MDRYNAAAARARIVALSRLAVRISREGLAGEPGAFAHWDYSRSITPLSVLALEGDGDALQQVIDKLKRMAASNYGADAPGCQNRLNDSFTLRSIVEAYHGLVDAGLVDADVQDVVAPWLYDFALAAADGRVQRFDEFQQWHLRNQNVPATCIYNIAHLLDRTQVGRFDTAPIWQWADRQIVGWNLTWRDPDDSWLYQFIWTWSAYLHARHRDRALLRSDNARLCCAFYPRLQPPGMGCDVVFGDSKPGDILGPMVAVLLGAKLHRDGELLHAALAMLEETEQRGVCINIVDRGPEMYRLYTLWPDDDVQPVTPPARESELIASPLPGRGWSFDEGTYAVDIKRTDRRFPFFGENTCCWDAMYQVQNAESYAQLKPDKLIFAGEDDEPFVLCDLRCHGLHDHADALGIVTLVDRGVPWLVESTYMPRDEMRLRWYHNVPLYRPGVHDLAALKHWRADTWREVEPDDVWLREEQRFSLAAAIQRHDGYDFVPFTEGMFDVVRVWLRHRRGLLVVVDQLIAARDGDVTAGQIWHTTASVARDGDAIELANRGETYHATFAQSMDVDWFIEPREAGQHDPFYFPPEQPVHDLLRGATRKMRQGDVLAFAACFSRAPIPLALAQDEGRTTVGSDDWRLTIAGLDDVSIEFQ